MTMQQAKKSMAAHIYYFYFAPLQVPYNSIAVEVWLKLTDYHVNMTQIVRRWISDE